VAIPGWNLVAAVAADYNRPETLRGLSHPVRGIELDLGRSSPIILPILSLHPSWSRQPGPFTTRHMLTGPASNDHFPSPKQLLSTKPTWRFLAWSGDL